MESLEHDLNQSSTHITLRIWRSHGGYQQEQTVSKSGSACISLPLSKPFSLLQDIASLIVSPVPPAHAPAGCHSKTPLIRYDGAHSSYDPGSYQRKDMFWCGGSGRSGYTANGDDACGPSFLVSFPEPGHNFYLTPKKPHTCALLGNS